MGPPKDWKKYLQKMEDEDVVNAGKMNGCYENEDACTKATRKKCSDQSGFGLTGSEKCHGAGVTPRTWDLDEPTDTGDYKLKSDVKMCEAGKPCKIFLKFHAIS